MYVHLKDRQYYEDLYDHHTVEDARRNIIYYDKFYSDFESKLPKDDTIDRPGNAILLNVFYMQVIGDELLARYESRDQYIHECMARDEAKDAQIANARLAEEPYCRHCNKQGLRITDKSLIHRKEGSNYNDPEEVLFMLHCPHCDKTSAFWEDGTAWGVKPDLCPKCNTEMKHKTSRSKQAIIITYTCPSCQHSYKDKMGMSEKKEEPDPDYDKDRIHYTLLDKEFRDKLFEIRRGLKQMADFGKEWKEREDNKNVYDAIKKLKKPKIAEITPLLQPTLEKAGYCELSLDKPVIGKDVFVGFNCLDTKSGRDDYDSKKILEKLIKKNLENTNWRLMSEGISYRLGYLNGRLRAYEREEDLKQLVLKSKKLVKPKINGTESDSGLRSEHSV